MNKLLKPFHWVLLGILSFFKAILTFIKWISLGIVKVFLEIFNYVVTVLKYDFIFLKVFFKYVSIGFIFVFNPLLKKIFQRKPKKIIPEKIVITSAEMKKNDNFLSIPLISKNKKKNNRKKIPDFLTDNDLLPKEKNIDIRKLKIDNKEELEKRKTKNKENAKLLKARAELLEELSKDVKREEKKTTYRYIAKNSDGEIERGIFSGFSKLDVNAYLVNEGFTVYQIKSSKWIDFVYGESSTFGIKMTNKDLIFWLTQLSTYIKAGIPLTESMRILSKQIKSRGKKKIFDNVVYQLTLGENFSSALEKQGNVFPSLLINMLKAAEATGELEETLDDMAEYYTEIETTRKQMISAMTYPAIITLFSLGVITFIMLYVIPKFIDVYDQADIKINGFTQAIINISSFLKNNISFLLLGIIAVLFIFGLLYKKVKSFRTVIQKFLMNLPIVGKVIIYKEITVFTKTFASLLKNNVLITESINILSKVTKNEVYKKIMFQTIDNITKGEKISTSFKNHWAIPDVAYYMIVTGESTGELPEMLSTVSRYYQEQHRSIVNNLKAFIEPIMIVTLAVIVGVIILAVIIPMFDLYNNIS